MFSHRSQYRYRRTNHFIDSLKSLKVPSKIVNNVVEDFRSRQNIVTNDIIKCLNSKVPFEITNIIIDYLKNYNNISIGAIQKYLRENDSWKCDDIIMSQISDEPSTFSSSDVSKLCSLFNEVSNVYDKCRGERLNFLSYAYVNNKLFRLVGYDEYCSYFPTLKSIDKLRISDKIWLKVCQELRWQPIL
jgi:hypothetical protein